MTVVAYRIAIVIGTLKSRAALKMESGIENSGAERVEPDCGGERVRGSIFGGKTKREEEGAESWRSESMMLST